MTGLILYFRVRTSIFHKDFACFFRKIIKVHDYSSYIVKHLINRNLIRTLKELGGTILKSIFMIYLFLCS